MKPNWKNELYKKYSVEKRFGEIVGRDYFGIVPYSLYKYQNVLQISNSEMWFLVWVIMHKWSDQDSFPSISALARRSGMTRPGIQNIIRSLRGKGLVIVEDRFLKNGAQASNTYDISPLIIQLEILIRADNDQNGKVGVRPEVAR